MRVCREQAPLPEARVGRLHSPRLLIYEDGPRGFHRGPTFASLVAAGDNYLSVGTRLHSRRSSV